MARLSKKAAADRERADRFSWSEVEQLWDRVQRSRTEGWDAGKALEHLVIRAFALSGLRVEWPYEVPVAGRTLEQIDGMVYVGDIPFLIECKDERSVDIEVIAKLRNQLMRRPPSTMGCVFVSGSFSRPAIILSDFAAPHRITLWSKADIAEGIRVRDFAGILRRKYHELCMFGLTDHSPHYGEPDDDAADE